MLGDRQLQAHLAALLPDLTLLATANLRDACGSADSGGSRGSSGDSALGTADSSSADAAEDRAYCWRVADCCVLLLTAPCIQPAVLQQAQVAPAAGRRSWPELLRHLLQVLPSERPADLRAQQYAALVLRAAAAAGRPFRALSADWAKQQRQRQQQQQAGMPGMAAMAQGSLWAAALLPGLARTLQLLLCGSGAAAQLASLPASDVKAACQAAAATVEMANAGLVAFEQKAADQGGSGSRDGSGSSRDRSRAGGGGDAPFLGLPQLVGGMAAASLAALRLAHFGAEVAISCGGAPGPRLPADFAETCLRASHEIAFRLYGMVRRGSAPLARASELRQHGVPAALCALHSAACRMAHRMAHRCAGAPQQHLEAAPVLAAHAAAIFAGVVFRCIVGLAAHGNGEEQLLDPM